MGKKQRWIGHYSSSHKILLVGEGDFSFSACLARAFCSAANMVATTLESEDTILIEHGSSEAHLEELERRGCLVLYEVNAYVMDRHPTLRSMKFDVIIFNFPHAGHYHRLVETDEELIELHRHLLKAFFKSARGMLSKGGEIHVSHRVDYPYDQWKLKELAEKAGLLLKEKVRFDKSDYPGYHNKRGGGIQSNKMFPLKNKESYTFKFSLKHASSEISVRDSTTSIGSDVPSLPGYQCYLCPPAPPSPPLREILRSGIQTTSRCEPKTQNPPHDLSPLVLRPITSPCNDPNPPSLSMAHCLRVPEERISPPLPPSCQDDDEPPAPPTPRPSRQVDDDNGCCSILGGWYAHAVLVPT